MSPNAGKRKVILKDIALKTGFSINTVSHALKDRPDISEGTKALIRRAADELGYIGNASASMLRSGISGIVAVIVGDISNPHFSIMIKEVEAHLRRFGYIPFVLNSDEDSSTEKQGILAAINKNVDGIIICPSPDGAANIEFLQSQGIPFVLIGRRLKQLDTNYVICDDEGGGYVATKHLLDKGRGRILFFNGARSISSAEDRLRGYRKALAECGVPYRKELVRTIPVTMGKGRERIARVLASPPEFDAILAFSDMIAWDIVGIVGDTPELKGRGIDVVGFDNIQSRFSFPVKLTSVSASKGAMAQKAVDVLMERIRNPELENRHVVLDTKLIVR